MCGSDKYTCHKPPPVKMVKARVMVSIPLKVAGPVNDASVPIIRARGAGYLSESVPDVNDVERSTFDKNIGIVHAYIQVG